VSRNSHHGTRPVGGEHVVGDPDRNLFTGYGVGRKGTRKSSALFVSLGQPSAFASPHGLFDVGFDLGALRGSRDLFDERVLRRENHVGRPEERVGAGREDFDSGIRMIRKSEYDVCALRATDPIALHLLDRFGPFDLVEVFDQAFRIARDAQHPLTHGHPHDRVRAALALAVDDFFVCEYRPQGGAPVHGDFGEVGQVSLIELAEDPLRPPEVARIRRVDLS
jgi:hypothetical protein